MRKKNTITTAAVAAGTAAADAAFAGAYTYNKLMS